MSLMAVTLSFSSFPNRPTNGRRSRSVAKVHFMQLSVPPGFHTGGHITNDIVQCDNGRL
jgi:hypothetical protein